ncbi:hypothetical protein SAMN05216503_1609 [Polaribacter sp. KT25b]|uniref:hypothetical protein n=1 Tax=Polaribacter sp. KT25b TaxID=1855336 RepID=UPI00087C5A06|nr:hypothetical protein [Polaribacter sp. KT25b]SDR98772.1 hypothetical protein SAMN05216503_1609 [Polaribacter sp. KT25b]
MEKKTFIKGASQPSKKNTIKFKGVTKKQIELLKAKRLPFAAALGLIAGIGSQYAFLSATGKIVEKEDVDTDETDAETEETFDFEVPTDIEFSDAVKEDMSFAEAFKTAREDTDGSGFFNWHGNTYHTLNKEEWDALSDEEKQEFYDKIKEHSDFDNTDYSKNDTDETDVIIDEDETDENNENEDETIDEEIIDEISYDDIVFNDDNDIIDSNSELEEFVTLDEIGETVDIIEGLNDGDATEEAEGIEGGVTYEETEIEETNIEDSSFEETDFEDSSYEESDNDDTSGDDIDYDDDYLDIIF